ncbi:cytokinin oxidase [Legionella quinlivanii]|uniref:Cytokinin oxidase n=1 Tax=Legionella quinlivanii TaxID=45073 RepID=A0A0W0Y4L0_9GAMM|nr:FAD-binding protein [Legionella quinlivanii]KTD51749.1 cytokinin oxidase [Legionella quinlivanii]SEF65126.1 FAD/FMN-containing dehydrogenase [Legionella quinlivanii DSM 21216]STY10723.1 Probable decaprenylphosphoryl-beta-D-ribose oxidase [Legionella quinlivanii]
MPLSLSIKNFLEKLPGVGRFSSVAAGMIDRAYLNWPKSYLGQLISYLKTRTIYVGLFLPLALLDMVASGALGIRYALGSFFTSDERQERRLTEQQKYSTLFSRNLYALLASVVGLFSPKLVIFYFTPDRKDKGIISGGGLHHSPNVQIRQPETIEEVQEIFIQARHSATKIMPVGAGRSQGKQYFPEDVKGGIAVDLSKLNEVEINSKEKTAIVGAGATWADIQLEANKHRLALQVMQASNVFSVGGSIGTNIHGWDHTKGVVSNTILSMDIVNGKGERITLTPEDPLFHKIPGSLGLLATVVSVKIQLTDNDLLHERGVEISLADYVSYFRETVQKDPNIKMHLFRLSLDPNNLLGSGVAVNYVKEGTAKPISAPHLRMESARGTRFNQIMVNLARRFGFIRKTYWEWEKTRLLANNSAPMTRNEIMQPPINAMFNPAVSESEWLQEFFVPEENLEDFTLALGQLLMDNEVILLNASIRFVLKHDAAPLSYAHDGDRFALVLCFNQSLSDEEKISVQKWLREAQALAVNHGGSYYLPYQHVSSPEDFEKSYPYASELIELKKEYDPDNLFVSGFFQKYLATKSPEVNHFKAVMANKETQKRFSGFLNNILQRIDSDKLIALMDDILKYKDSHEEIYEELCRRLPEVRPGTLTDFRRTLNSLSSIKTDLGAQAQSLLPEDMTTIDGLVEIGYPGRFVSGFKQNNRTIKGQIVAVYKNPSITDYVQTGFPRPYHRFEKLHYKHPGLANLKDNSADVITCYVGLHHFPEEELDKFLLEIRRVLRKDGRFLLVDHDVIDDESMSMAHMAHTIFNAVTGVPLNKEIKEIRNFQPMTYWKERLAKCGLGYAVEGPEVPLIRKGDPSRNRMVSFNKAAPKLELVNSATQEMAEEPTETITPKPSVELNNGNSEITAGQWRANTRPSSLNSGLPLFADTRNGLPGEQEQAPQNVPVSNSF